ncbi:DNA-binding CsgD family transcriptional regulator/energy-coupling factor transporter ATP-binding protein EcfA2 [Microbacterium sp. BE35]|uniref:LuxR C-terminal-related transcriptional regulator n=1 Tax=Microbacterium sp. BE35 TaxID=2817773 RepID=UPI00286319F6|nr:LuxR C-terminal-related transcriptional regulator [Microbacterium sp. BE35]MDR7188747.1 DNA-binding CsgD family transcriptional regulator/energy-coupling factor transporter ATP-binding protein EcfA2 [Microbacterium sp. BE35]
MSAITNVVRIDHSVPTPAGPASQVTPVLVAAARSVELDAFRFAGRSLRLVVSGSAGSGKTVLLHHLAGLLAAEGTATIGLRAGTDVPSVPRESVLLVDDAHLLSQAQVAALIARAEDPDAGLVVALRSWPARPDLTTLGRLLERTRPALLLGEVSASRLREEPGVGFGACDDDILRLTGGIAWLVHECAAAHDAADCCDPGHFALQRAIRPRVRHRLESASPRLRRLVEDLSLGLFPTEDAAPTDEPGALLAEGYAEGLLTGEGRPAPAIAETARAMTPVTRLPDVIRAASPHTLRDGHLTAWLAGIPDPHAADALVTRARQEAPRDADLAARLFDLAVACGAEASALAEERAWAAWAAGRLDEAGVLLDGLLAHRDGARGRVVDLAAAVWAERGMMPLAHDTYRLNRPAHTGPDIHERIAALAAGDPSVASAEISPDARGAVTSPPSTLGTAHTLLDRGLTATLDNAPDAAVSDLQRASELYTASADRSPSVELPAVIAAAAAIGVGDPATAQAIVDTALHGGQGGVNRRARLELWSSWIALQRERPDAARAALTRATSARALTPRDDALAATISIGLARRYDDAAGLAAEWRTSRPRISRAEPDLFSLLALSELVIAAARLGDAVSMQPAFERALELVGTLGDPPIWSAPLHWAGIQRGILLNHPDALAPHARALVAAAAHNRLAARMAHAGKVWTAVLAGTVDPDAVEGAARGLAAVGLAWDGARLAGHGASRSDDRKVIAHLLACARELHPRETARPSDEGQDAATGDLTAEGPLSEREREVAELVLQGKTYAEIGAAIFISPRTAEHHIAHIRRRLNATSRSDLLSKLRIALEGGTQVTPDTERGGRRG